MSFKVKRLTFQERIDVVKFAATHGRAAAIRHFGVSRTQLKTWVAFERAGRRELCDPACKHPGITGELLQKVFFDLENNGLSLLELCIKYGFKGTGSLSAILKKARSGKSLHLRRGRPPREPRPQDADPLEEKLPELKPGATRQELEELCRRQAELLKAFREERECRAELLKKFEALVHDSLKSSGGR